MSAAAQAPPASATPAPSSAQPQPPQPQPTPQQQQQTQQTQQPHQQQQHEVPEHLKLIKDRINNAAIGLQNWLRQTEVSDADMLQLAMLAAECKEVLELSITEGAYYGDFLQQVVPFIVNVISERLDTSRQRDKPTASVHKVRVMLFEVLGKLQVQSIEFKHLAKPLLTRATSWFEIETEENALLCMHLVIDTHRIFHNDPDMASKLIDMMIKMFEVFEDTVERNFSAATNDPSQNLGGRSFKIIAECPVTVMCFLSFYKKDILPKIQQLIPHVFKIIEVSVKPESIERNKAQFPEFINAQNKALSLLVHLLKQPDSSLVQIYREMTEQYQDKIPLYFVHLLRTCPKEPILCRKEILASLKNVMGASNPEIKTAFFEHLDLFLEENLLSGTGKWARDGPKQIASVVFVDLFTSCRECAVQRKEDFTQKQKERIIDICLRNLHDNDFSFFLQSNHVRVLNTLVDASLNVPSNAQLRGLSVSILAGFANKLRSIKALIPRLMAEQAEQEQSQQSQVPNPSLPMLTSAGAEIWTTTPSGTVKDCKQLIKGIINGMKNLLTSISRHTMQTPDTTQSVALSTFLLPREVKLLKSFFKHALHCFQLTNVPQGSSQSHAAEDKDARDFQECIWQMAHILDARLMQDVVEAHLSVMFEPTICSSSICLLARQLCYSSPVLLEAMIAYLLACGRQPGRNDRCTIIVTMWKAIFPIISASHCNDNVFAPHVHEFVAGCMEQIGNGFIQYTHALKSFFKSFMGKPDSQVMKELLSMLPSLLESFSRLRQFYTAKEVFAELALCVPLRLTSIVPWLYLVAPAAIQALTSCNQDIFSSGLRFLEMCSESFGPYFDTTFAPFKQDLLKALCRAVRPPPSSSNSIMHTPLHVLGKLGGRSRVQQPLQPVFPSSDHAPDDKAEEESCAFIASFLESDQNHPNVAVPFSINIGKTVNTFRKYIVYPEYQKNIFLLCKTVVSMFMSVNITETVSLAESSDTAMDVEDELHDTPLRLWHEASRTSTTAAQFANQQACFLAALATVFIAASQPALKADADTFIAGTLRHFALLLAQRNQDKYFGEIDPISIIDAIINMICENRDSAPRGMDMKNTKPQKKMFCESLISKLCHCCYKRSASSKMGGCIGLGALVEVKEISEEWVQPKTKSILNALFASLRDYPTEITSGLPQDVMTALLAVVRNFYSKKALAIVSATIGHLLSLNSIIRASAQKVLQELTLVVKQELYKLIEPAFGDVAVKLKAPLSGQNPLSQIAQIEALTFLIRFCQPLVSTPDLFNIMSEALKIVGPEDSAMYPDPSNVPPMSNTTVDLKKACVFFLECCLRLPDLSVEQDNAAQSQGEQNALPPKDPGVEMRLNICSMLCKLLLIKGPQELVSVVDTLDFKAIGAVCGLKRQTSLYTAIKPVLGVIKLEEKQGTATALAARAFARVSLLHGSLANNLVTDRAITVLNSRVETACIPRPQQVNARCTEIKVIKANLELFTLRFQVPKDAESHPSKYTNSLVGYLVTLESKLAHQTVQPLYEPVAKFLNTFPEQSCEWFARQFDAPSFDRTTLIIVLCHLLKQSCAANLYAAFCTKQSARLAADLTLKSPRLEEAVQIVTTLSRVNPEWLPGKSANEALAQSGAEVRAGLLSLWGEFYNAHSSTNPQDKEQLRNTEELIRKTALLLRRLVDDTEDSVPAIYDLLPLFKFEVPFDLPEIRDLFAVKIFNQYSSSMKEKLVRHYFVYYARQDVAMELKAMALRRIIVPIFQAWLPRPKAPTESMDTSESEAAQVNEDLWINTIWWTLQQSGLFDLSNVDKSIAKKVSPPKTLSLPEIKAKPTQLDYDLIGEIVHLLLILSSFATMIEKTPDLCDICISMLSKIRTLTDDVTIKCYVRACMVRFTYCARMRIVQKFRDKLFFDIVNVNDPETQSIMRETIDLALDMAQNGPRPPTEDSTWPDLLKKYVDRNSTKPNVINQIISLILRHPNGKLAGASNNSAESKKTVLDTCELLITWEKARVGKLEENIIQLPGIPAVDAAWIPDFRTRAVEPTDVRFPAAPKDTLFFSLIRVTVFSQADSPLCERAFGLLRIVLKLWPEMKRRLPEKYFASTHYDYFQALRLINLWCEDDTFLGLHSFSNFLCECIVSRLFLDPRYNDITAVLVCNVKQAVRDRPQPPQPAVPQPEPPRARKDVYQLASAINSFIESTFSPKNMTERSLQITNACIVLKQAALKNPEFLDEHLAAAITLFQKLQQNHLTPAEAVESSSPPAATSPNSGGPSSSQQRQQSAQASATMLQHRKIAKEAAQLLVPLLEVLRHRAAHPEHKKMFLYHLQQLVDKTSDQEVFYEIIRIMHGWVVAPDANSIQLSMKEKCFFVAKFQQHAEMVLNERADKVLGLFHDIVFHLKKEALELEVRSQISKPEATAIEVSYNYCMSHKDPAVRARFAGELYSNARPLDLGKRLLAILKANWDGLASSYWLRLPFEILFLSLDLSKPLQLSPWIAHLPSAFHNGPKKQCPAGLEVLLAAEESFMRSVSSLSVEALVTPLRELCWFNPDVVHHLWGTLFSAAWVRVTDDERAAANAALCALLTRDSHLKQHSGRPNPLQALVNSILRCRTPPQAISATIPGPVPAVPQMPLPQMRFLAKTANSWHVVTTLLEERDAQYSSQKSLEEHQTLSELYSELAEDDFAFSCLASSCSSAGSEDTRSALSLEQFSMYEAARDMYLTLLSNAKASVGTASHRDDVALWETRWAACSRKLGNWSELFEYGREADKPEVMLDASWHNEDWNSVKEVLPRVVGDEDSGNYSRLSPMRHLVQCYLALHASVADPSDRQRMADVDSHLLAAKNVMMRSWQFMPQDSMTAHMKHLHMMQLIEEVQEFITVHRDLMSIAKSQQQLPQPPQQGVQVVPPQTTAQMPLLRTLLLIWRDRLPNVYEDLVSCHDVFSWRKAAYGVMGSLLVAARADKQYTGDHELAWHIVKLARFLRKRGLHNQSHQVLHSIYSLKNIEIGDAVAKIKEQLKLYVELRNVPLALSSVQNVNMDHYQLAQISVFFRLKGLIFDKAGKPAEANAMFSNAITLNEHDRASWAMWGDFNTAQYLEQKRSSPLSDVSAWAQGAVLCHLQALRFSQSTSHRARFGSQMVVHAARVLWLLDAEYASVHDLFDRAAQYVPSWAWIPWIPQLIESLGRQEMRCTFEVLVRIAQVYPQALFYPLQAFILCESQRVNESLMMSANAPPQTPPLTPPSVSPYQSPHTSPHQSPASSPAKAFGPLGAPKTAMTVAQQVLRQMTIAHKTLVSRLKELARGLHTPFLPTPREIAAVYLGRALMKTLSPLGGKQSAADDVREAREAAVNTADHVLVRRIDTELVAAIEDLGVSSDEMATRLRTWVARMQQSAPSVAFSAQPGTQAASQAGQRVLHIEALSAALSAAAPFRDLEVPGQYTATGLDAGGDPCFEPQPERHVHIETVYADVVVMPFADEFVRCVGFVSDTGRTYWFRVHGPLQCSSGTAVLREEKTVQLQRLVGAVAIARSPESRGRGLSPSPPAVVSVFPQLKLVCSATDSASLWRVHWDSSLRSASGDPYRPVFAAAAQGGRLGDAASYRAIRQECVDADALTSYVVGKLGSLDRVFEVRKAAMRVVATQAILGRVFGSGPRAASQVYVSPSTQCVVHAGFAPDFEERSADERPAVPFRLTPTLVRFMREQGVAGPLAGGMVATILALHSGRERVRDVLRAFTREDFALGEDLETMGTKLAPEDAVVKRIEEMVAPELTAVHRVKAAVGVAWRMIDDARSDTNLSKMDPTWLPWV
eukprot:m51a1_g1573 putative fat domain-containing protein (3787) ;mRNA; f:74870-87151